MTVLYDDNGGGGVLQGRIAVITGASGNIGSIVTQRFAKEGANLILVGKDVDKLKALYNIIQEVGVEVMIAPIDLQSFDSIKDLALSIKTKFKFIDILVASASVSCSLSPVQEYDPVVLKEVMDVNFFANWYLIKYFDALLKSSLSGRAIFLTSEITHSLSSYPYCGLYASSKAALEAMIRVYAAETKHSKMCVNMICSRQSDSETYAYMENLTDKFVDLASESCSVTGQLYKLEKE
ncbi:SDR family NAD(P)-dependent oxidoreductase [Candidatus Neoehrlichia procyonis]|uniref:Short chain dehydrogenase family protein n=1 Tax=Candidatus Neoehrlichia procyonis str. RAC413 TaxID=1359163 RepID=A0A0F3NM20_9RICK|nr:SDR family oxidoreductase [Candidatus Neoehrlichia lotoris]KJV69098.1 short chain dehydrogenase family protein [Candidatus Neoehrlichia lotoris str. RAC413]